MPYKGEAKRIYQREWVKRRRADWITQNGPCARCGSSDELNVDHIDPTTKLMNPQAVWGLTAHKRLAELAKCQVLCRDCHVAKSKADGSHAIGEGGGSTRLREADIAVIRTRFAAGETMTCIAESFGVHKATIFKVIHRRTWKQVP
jgi:hypothetical protein